MVELLNTIVTDGAMRSARRSEDLAREAELELDGHPVDDNLLGAGRGAPRHVAVRVRGHVCETLGFSCKSIQNNL